MPRVWTKVFAPLSQYQHELSQRILGNAFADLAYRPPSYVQARFITPLTPHAHIYGTQSTPYFVMTISISLRCSDTPFDFVTATLLPMSQQLLLQLHTPPIPISLAPLPLRFELEGVACSPAGTVVPL